VDRVLTFTLTPSWAPILVVGLELMLDAEEAEAAMADATGERRHRERTPAGRVDLAEPRRDQEIESTDGDLRDAASGGDVDDGCGVAGFDGPGVARSRVVVHRLECRAWHAEPMRALIQRVSRAEVRSREGSGEEYALVGSIGQGICALVGATHADDVRIADRLADKIVGLRIFDDEDGVMNRSVTEVGGSVLVVSQFTLYGDTRKGRRPSWIDAARPEHAEPLVERVAARIASSDVAVATGRFRTEMEVELVNDGPVTLLLEL